MKKQYSMRVLLFLFPNKLFNFIGAKDSFFYLQFSFSLNDHQKD